MDYTEETYDTILEMVREGLGRRQISKELGLSEWAVRKIINTIVENGHANYAKPGRPSDQKLVIPEPLVEKLVIPEPLVPVLTVSKSKIKETALIISDVHVPFECKKSLEVFKAYAKDNMPETLVLLGDILDLFSVSKYDKCMRGKDGLPEELEAGRAFFREMREIFPDARIIFTMGNHEDRYQAFLVNKAPELIGIDEFRMERLLALESLDIEFYDSNTPVKLGELVLTHGSLARKGAGSSVRGLREKYGNVPIIQGHVHKSSVAYVRTMDDHHLMIENPCMAKLDVDYGKHLDFINGFTELYIHEDGKMAASSHVIRNGRLITPSGDVYECN